MSYAPREPSRELLLVIERLAHANHSDSCIVSGETLKRLVLAWFGIARSMRWIWYHLAAASREHLIIRQTRWRAVGGKLMLKARTRYRLGYRYLQRLGRGARGWAQLAALVSAPWRRETVQKVAIGLQTLIGSIVPAVP
jgi:hypothetical protein